MAMTLRLPEELESELRIIAEEDHRSMHQTVIRALDQYVSARETAVVKADSEALLALVEARQSDVVYGTDAVWDVVASRDAS